MNDQQTPDQTIEELLKLPAFQNLLGKAESHQWKFRPKESERLQNANQLNAMLHQRTKQCWDSLKALRQKGMTQAEAQEVALPTILVPGEKE